MLSNSVCLFTAGEIEDANDRLAERINRHYKSLAGDNSSNQEVLVLCVLTGAMTFTADLIRKLSFPLFLDTLKVSRYHNQTSGAQLQWHARPLMSVEGRTVLILDDIFDEGETMAALVQYCTNAGAASVSSAVLLDKLHDRKKANYKPNFVGLVCPDEYVFGYGMDYEGSLRQLPAIYYLNKF